MALKLAASLTCCLLTSTTLTWAGSIRDAHQVSIEELNLFPGRYLGQTLTFNDIWFWGKLSRRDDLYFVSVVSESQQILAPGFLSTDHVSFIISPTMAEKIVKFVKSDSVYGGRIRCTIEKHFHDGKFYWIGRVSELSILEKSGKPYKTFND